MIVSWTIRGNDVFPTFPQGRMICVCLKITRSTRRPEQPFALHQHQADVPLQHRLLIFIDLDTSCRYIIGLCARSRLHLEISLWIPFKADYLTPFVTLTLTSSRLPPLPQTLQPHYTWMFFLRFLGKRPQTRRFDLASIYFMQRSTMTHVHPRHQASSCVLHFPKFLPLHRRNFHSAFTEKQSSFISLHSGRVVLANWLWNIIGMFHTFKFF